MVSLGDEDTAPSIPVGTRLAALEQFVAKLAKRVTSLEMKVAGMSFLGSGLAMVLAKALEAFFKQ
jgi:hypothetical protein